MFRAKHHKNVVGKLGEKVASIYLIKKHYQILIRNYRRKFGEIDIVARALDGTLVFCEVKTLLNKSISPMFFAPEDNATPAKLRKMRRMASFFAGKYSKFIKEDKGWRIDLITIVFRAKQVFNSDKHLAKQFIVENIHHYENVA